MGLQRMETWSKVFLTLDSVGEWAEQRKLKSESPSPGLLQAKAQRRNVCIRPAAPILACLLGWQVGWEEKWLSWCYLLKHGTFKPRLGSHWPQIWEGDPVNKSEGYLGQEVPNLAVHQSLLDILESCLLSGISTGGAWLSVCLKSYQLLPRPTLGNQQAEKTTKDPSKPWLRDSETSREVGHGPGEF